MTTKLICGGLEFWFGMIGITPYIRCKICGNDGSSQGIISIEHTTHLSEYYYLYKWYDDGYFPSCFDTVNDSDDEDEDEKHVRLRIVGVDQI